MSRLGSSKSDDLPVTLFRGRLGWSHAINAYPLPEGMPSRLPIVVLSVDEWMRTVEAWDGENVWKLLWINIDLPQTYRFPDSRREFPEWHRRSRDHMQRGLDHAIRNRTERVSREGEKVLEWHLERSAKPHPLGGRKLPPVERSQNNSP